MTDRYIVTAPYVTVRVRQSVGGEVLLGFYKDAPLPEETNQDDVERHLRKGMVEKLSAGEAKQLDKAEAEADKAAEAAAKQAADEAGADAKPAAKSKG